MLKRYLAKPGRDIQLLVGDQHVLPGYVGGFDGVGRRLVLRSHPTEYEVWHELGHYLDFRKKGQEFYNIPALHPRVDKEQVVFDMLENSKRWERLTYEQQQHAIWYIQSVGGVR